MVRGGAAGFEQLDAAARISGGGVENFGKFEQRNVVRTGAGDQRAAGSEQTQRTEVQLLVAAQSAFSGPLAFGEGGRIEHDRRKLRGQTGKALRPFARCGDGAGGLVERSQKTEGVGFKPVCFSTETGVGRAIAVCDLEGGAGLVDAP